MTIQLSIKEAARLGLTEQSSAQPRKRKTSNHPTAPLPASEARVARRRGDGDISARSPDWENAHEPYVRAGWSFRCVGREMQHVAKHWQTGRIVGPFQTRRELLRALEGEHADSLNT